MTTITSFVPSATSVFQFTAVLDGVSYTVFVTWNLSGRWYINIYDTNGNLILCRSLVGSPPNYDIDLVKFYFTSTLVYRESTGNFEVNP